MNSSLFKTLFSAACGVSIGIVIGAIGQKIIMDQQMENDVKTIAMMDDEERNKLFDDELTKAKFKMLTDEL